jgi:hypothetical protein
MSDKDEHSSLLHYIKRLGKVRLGWARLDWVGLGWVRLGLLGWVG